MRAVLEKDILATSGIEPKILVTIMVAPPRLPKANKVKTMVDRNLDTNEDTFTNVYLTLSHPARPNALRFMSDSFFLAHQPIGGLHQFRKNKIWEAWILQKEDWQNVKQKKIGQIFFWRIFSSSKATALRLGEGFLALTMSSRFES